MSNIIKISPQIKNYLILRKKRNINLSCRSLGLDVYDKFKINISKSTISNIFKDANLSSPVGRTITKVYPGRQAAPAAGFVFLLGANCLSGLSKSLTKVIQKSLPMISLKHAVPEQVSEAWLISKAVYNVPLERIENYEKDELWPILGRKIKKGLFQEYIQQVKFLQPIMPAVIEELNRQGEAISLDNANDSIELDDLFSALVKALNFFSQKSFFPRECHAWSWLKMREVFYKRSGLVKRETGQDIIFELDDKNLFQETQMLDFAVARFNEAPIFDYSGKKLWLSRFR